MLEFNPDAHEYRWNGQRVPGVSEILRLSGIAPENPYHNDNGKDRGQMVHSATHYLDENDLAWESLPPDIEPYVRAYEQFKADSGFKPELVEHRVYHPVYCYAGTLDRTGLIGEQRVLIDIKTGASAVWHGIQLAAYKACLEGNYHRYSLELRSNGKYKLRRHDDPNDLNVFLSAITILNWKRSKGVLA